MVQFSGGFKINGGYDVRPTLAPPSLYAFTSFTFSPASLTGRYGPTLSNCTSYYDTTTYPWLLNTNYFNVSSGAQFWTVPKTGNYTFVLGGSRAGQVSGQGYASGNGAKIQATLSLTSGTVILIICGQYEDSANTGAITSYYGLGGGGGTFVYNYDTSTLLLAAGGGGGASYYSGAGYSGVNGTTSTTGTNSGGTAGNGGTISGSGSYIGGAGAGFLTAGYNGNGTDNSKPFAQTSYYGEGGYTFSQGFYGGDYNYAWGNPSSYAATHGGYGGGGGSNGIICGGGGGGYSGGGLSSVGTYNGQAGGGGSYIVSTATSVATSDGQYNGSGTFNGASITNLSSFNTTFGSVSVTSL
jgi:hypothetical protein